MRILIAEDEFISRRIIKEILSAYGNCDVVIDGEEAVQAFQMAHEDKVPYDLICMDIMMPNLDGHTALQQIRDMEKQMKIKPSQEARIIMVTALDDPKTVIKAYYQGGATDYIIKPIEKTTLIEKMRAMSLLD
jgi:two-component system chemotaxis response regulator CheY